jgi:hypothetical protein
MAAKTDAEHLEELREMRDNLVTALKTPEVFSPFGGAPNSNVGKKLDRMGGRAELRAELDWVEQRIADLEASIEDGPTYIVTRGAF